MFPRRRHKNKAKSGSWKRLFGVTSMVALALGIGAMIGILWVGTQDLPTFESLQDYQPSLVSRCLCR